MWEKRAARPVSASVGAMVYVFTAQRRAWSMQWCRNLVSGRSSGVGRSQRRDGCDGHDGSRDFADGLRGGGLRSKAPSRRFWEASG